MCARQTLHAPTFLRWQAPERKVKKREWQKMLLTFSSALTARMASEQRLGQTSPLGSTARFRMCVAGSSACSRELISTIPAAVSAADVSEQFPTRSADTYKH